MSFSVIGFERATVSVFRFGLKQSPAWATRELRMLRTWQGVGKQKEVLFSSSFSVWALHNKSPARFEADQLRSSLDRYGFVLLSESSCNFVDRVSGIRSHPLMLTGL